MDYMESMLSTPIAICPTVGFRIFHLTVAAAILLQSVSTAHATLLSTCKTIATVTNIEIEWPKTPAYDADQALYWSITCSVLQPSCILVPKTPKELSTIIKTLRTTKEKFAVKSGGHNPNVNFASIQDGPLISLKAFNSVIYDAKSSTAKIGPGNRWTAVAKALEPHGVAVSGGRIGEVGVGGYLVGGGLSYLSTQHGWGMNTVVSYEVVLANGEIVKASKSENEDLYKVLKGGGNGFGIVTSYKLKAFPIGQIWGGNLIFVAPRKDIPSDGILSGIRNFVEHYPDDRAALIASAQYNVTSELVTWILLCFWDGPTPPTGLFNEFIALKPVINSFAPTTFVPFVSSFDGLLIDGGSIDIATETTPLPNAAVGIEVLRSYYDHLINTTIANKEVQGLTGQITFQPAPKRMAAHAVASGGDLLELDPYHDLIILEFNWDYASALSLPQMNKATLALVGDIRDRVLAFVKAGKLAKGVNLPLFMNDANIQQDYFGRLKKGTRDFAKRVQKKYDPTGLFALRTGGFKL